MSVYYTVLKVVSYYDSRFLHVSDVSKNKFGWGVGGWVELYPSFFLIFGMFLTLQSPLSHKTPEIFLQLFHPHCVLLFTSVLISPLLCGRFPDICTRWPVAADLGTSQIRQCLL